MRESVVVDVITRLDVTCDLTGQEVGDHQIAFEWPSSNADRQYVLSHDGLASLPAGMREEDVARRVVMALMKVNPPAPSLAALRQGVWLLRTAAGDIESSRFVGPGGDGEPFPDPDSARTWLDGRVAEGREAPNTSFLLFLNGHLIGRATTVVSVKWA